METLTTSDAVAPAVPRHSGTFAAWLAVGLGLAAMFTHISYKMWYGWFPAWGQVNLDLYHRLTDGESYYTHGPLILLVSGGMLVFLLRRCEIEPRPRRLWGSLAAAFCILVYLLGCVVDSNVIRGGAWIGLVASIVLLAWGTNGLRRLWFPIAFLWFMLPMPTWFISDVNLALKLMATTKAVWLANFVGIPTEHLGAQIMLEGDKTLVVSDVCSGLRSLISLLAFGALYAYVCRLRGLWRVGLFLASIPVALTANCLRIASIVVVAHFWSVDFAAKTYHDRSGIVVFILSFLMLYGLESLVLTAYRWAGRPIQPRSLLADLHVGAANHARALFGSGAGAGALWVLATLCLLAGGASWYLERPKSMWDERTATVALPVQIEVGGRTLTGSSIELDEHTLTLLGTRDYLYRRYSAAGRSVDICIVFSKGAASSTHPPELCLTAGGANVYWSGETALDGLADLAAVPCRELAVRDSDSADCYYIYTYKYGDSYTVRFGKQQVLLFFKNRLLGKASGALIRVSTPIDSGRDEARRQAMEFMRAAMPYLDRSLR